MPWRRLGPCLLEAQRGVILFNTGVWKLRTRDRQMLDRRKGKKEGGGGDGTGSLFSILQEALPSGHLLVGYLWRFLHGTGCFLGFIVCGFLFACLFLHLLVFPVALSTVLAAASSPSRPDFFRAVFFLLWGHRGRLSVIVLFSSSPHSCSHLSSSHVPRLALVFPLWPWVLWGCICILHCAERISILDPHLKQRPVLSIIN